jgi:hypothetical protein
MISLFEDNLKDWKCVFLKALSKECDRHALCRDFVIYTFTVLSWDVVNTLVLLWLKAEQMTTSSWSPRQWSTCPDIASQIYRITNKSVVKLNLPCIIFTLRCKGNIITSAWAFYSNLGSLFVVWLYFCLNRMWKEYFLHWQQNNRSHWYQSSEGYFLLGTVIQIDVWRFSTLAVPSEEEDRIVSPSDEKTQQWILSLWGFTVISRDWALSLSLLLQREFIFLFTFD